MGGDTAAAHASAVVVLTRATRRGVPLLTLFGAPSTIQEALTGKKRCPSYTLKISRTAQIHRVLTTWDMGYILS